MKALYVDLEREWRGGQNQVLLILRGLKARGHTAELVTAAGSALEERAAAIGVQVHPVSRGMLRITAARKIRELLRTGRFDLIHANEAHAVSASWLARAHRRVPFVISRRVGYPIGKSRLARTRYEAAARIVAISNWVAERVTAAGLPKDKLSVVYDGVELPAIPSGEARRQARIRWGIADDAPLLGCAGVLLPDKGQDLLIRALAELRGEFPKAKLLLAGDGPDRSRLEQLAIELGVRDAVVFAGFIKEIETVYVALDVFLFPSRFDGMGTSLLAAMSYEVPSVAFSCCAFGEIIEHDRNGLLVESGNVRELEKAVTRILRDPEFARRIGMAGRRRIEENFSEQTMVEEMIHVYKMLVQRNP
jgi:glycosyltransferase involved in cell wall biosynthesis